MYLYHAFPRPPSSPSAATELYPRARSILRSILYYGILCTPEELHIFPDPNTEYRQRQALLASGQPEERHLQSRACFTLCTTEELFQKKVRGLSPSETGPAFELGAEKSHADLFGPYAIAIDPISARRIGIAPTSYYSPNDIFGERYAGSLGTTPGLNYQIISRLKEVREILTVLSYVEGDLKKDGYTFPNSDELSSLGFDLKYDQPLLERLKRMRKLEKEHIFRLFYLDREPAFNLVGFVNMMLNLFQQTDSSLSDDILAFYQQREFRLIHHMRRGAIWYSLGKHPEFLNPLHTAKEKEIKFLREILSNPQSKQRTEHFYRHCWVLESVDGFTIRDYVDHIVAPAREISWVRAETERFGLGVSVIPAEDYGYTES